MSGVAAFILSIGMRIGRRTMSRMKNWSDVPDWLFALACVICLFIAGYQAWSDEHTKLAELQEKFGKPDFKAFIEDITPGRLFNIPVVWMIVSLTNNGRPSAAGPFDLDLQLYGNRIVRGERRSIPPLTRITYKNGGVEYVYGDDALDVKAIKATPSGDRIYGRLLFDFPGVPPQDLDSLQSLYVLHFTDTFGNQYSAARASGGTVSGALEFPGLRPRFLPPQNGTAGGNVNGK
jgi:hypothetical protein